MASIGRTHIAYRCPECGVATVGLLGGLTKVSDMLRLKCDCGKSSLDIKRQEEGKIRLSVPCVYCKGEHGYVVSADIVLRDGTTRLSCPYSSMDILFIADEGKISEELNRSADELSRVMASLEAETLSDIQPQDVGEAEESPDPTLFDTFNFLIKDLESDGNVKCPCQNGDYELRFCDEGMEVVCKNCGASFVFHAKTQAMAENYLGLDEIKLS